MDVREKIYQMLDKQEYSEARSLIARLGETEPAEAAGLLTALEIEAGEIAAAKAAWKKLSSLLPTDSYTRFLEARIAFLSHEYKRALEILKLLVREEMPPAYQEKVLNLYAQCARLFGDTKSASKAYKLAAQVVPDMELKALEYSDYLFNLHYAKQSLSAQKQEAAVFDVIFSKVRRFLHAVPVRRKKLRIGYISGDLRNHVVLRFVYALFGGYDKEKFEVYAYANNPEDEYSQHLRSLVDGWRNIFGVSDALAARQIYEDGIDILVDFSGHTKGNRLPVLAYKPAPVQISGIGYFASTGLSAVDYFLSDVHLAEKNAQEGFTEELLVLSESHFCYTPLKKVALPPCAAFEKNGYITFGSFNNFTKVNDEVLSLWKSLLDEIPSARLLLKTNAFDFEDTKKVALQRLENAGFDLCRVECRRASKDYLKEYGDMDIALDTFPYPGGGTTCDALYMGVPVITMTGESHGERFGASILENLGLGELVASCAEDYISKAKALSENTELLSLLHKNLRSMMQNSPLMDEADYQKSMEEAYRMVWEHYMDTQELPDFVEQKRLLLLSEKWQAQGDKKQALAAVTRVLSAKPENFDTLFRLAEIAIDQKNAGLTEKIAAYMERQDEEDGRTYLVKAYGMYLGHEKLVAISFAERAISADLHEIQKGMAWHLLAELQKSVGNRIQAAKCYLESSRLQQKKENQLTEYSNYLLNLQYKVQKKGFIRNVSEQYGRMLSEIVPYTHEIARHQHKRLRIGYISPDFCRHVVACFARAFFADADRMVFSTYAYALNREVDEVTEEFSGLAEHFTSLVGLDASLAAKKIYEDEIDILVDFSGHTGYNALPILAYKPAPVQISGIGYFSTTGLPAVDYFLSDAFLAEENAEEDFTEKLLVLPHSHWCYQPLDWMKRPVSPAPFKENGYITFGCLNHFDKVTDEMLMVWSEILSEVKGAKLFLKSGVFDDAVRKEEAIGRLKAAGIPLERVIFEGRTEDYLSAYERIDLALDTFPYLGGGTTCDALYMGVPVIAMKDGTHHGRFAYSLLKNAGISDLCTDTVDNYIQLAVMLAKDKERLAKLHQTLRRMLSKTAVFDGKRYMTDVESAYRSVWRNWLEGQGCTPYAAWKAELLKAQEEQAEEALQRLAFWLTHLENRELEAERVCAFRHYVRGEYRRAAELAEHCVSQDAEDEELRYIWIDSLEKLGNLPKVMELCGAYFEDHKSPYSDVGKNLLLLRAFVHSKMGSKKAISDYRELYENDGDTGSYGSWLLSYNAFPIDEEKFFEFSKGFGKLFENVRQYTHKNHPKHKKLRIGYISPDFRMHVMFHFYVAMFFAYDREQFEVYGYALGAKRDTITEQLRGMATKWRDLQGKSAEESAEIIYRDEIDILFDLAGHTMDGGLSVLAYKPAPVQISGLGYMATTGLPAVNYFLTDRYVDPVGVNEKYFTEKLLRLKSQFCYSGVFGGAPPVSEGAPCKERGWVLFGVFNAYRKYQDEMLLVWKEILESVPKSKLLIKSQVLFSPEMQEEAYHRFAGLGFDMDRVIFEQATTDYMYRYLDVDIALDTYPYPGGGTTCDSLYMGVPVITRYSSRHSSRFSYSILKNAGLDGLAVQSGEEYIERAAGLAKDVELLDILHKNLRSMLQKSMVMDMGAYMENLEEVYREIWKDFEGKKNGR